MSMNLTCDEMELLQTPTFITWMCLSYNPISKQPDGGWQGILRRYEYWVEAQSNGAYESKKDHDETVKFYTDHINKLKKIANKKGYLTFSYE